MKNIFKTSLVALMSLLALASCDPQENDDHSLGAPDTVTEEEVTFTQIVSDKSENVVTFTCTTKLDHPFTIAWDLGNGTTGKSATVTGEYPMAGDYTVTLTISTADGTSASKSAVLHFANNDFSLIDTPAYRNLTGGIENTAGKVWVFDQYNNFTDEVAKATGKNIKGHLGLGPIGHCDQEWWGAGPSEKGDKWSIYSFKFTFKQEGVQLKIENKGEGYGRAKHAATGGFDVSAIEEEDCRFPYSGGDYTFSLTESGEFPKLTLSGNAFMGYYCGTQEYDIFYQTEEVMALRMSNELEGQDWVVIFCREDLNVEAPAVEKTVKAVPLNDDFEEESLDWVAESMGDKSGIVDNPALVPINTSDKVYRYQKSTEFYSNISFTASDYLFDLTTQNKIRLKVFIPAYNDYVTENDVAGEWITNKKLLPQLAVKLQDSSKGGNAWETQTEIVKADLEMGKWLDLEFDFSSVKDRQDYDKIVIQFGAEGHAGPGIFFFDDFSFGE